MQNNPLGMEDQVPSSTSPQQEGNYYVDPEGERYQNPAEFDQAQPQLPQPPILNFQQMREKALQDAILQVTQRSTSNPPQVPQQYAPMPETVAPVMNQLEPKVVYVKRNLTLAELLLTLLLACGLVTGVQFVWGVATDLIPRIEIRDK